MFGRQIVLLTIVACTSAIPAAAQAPAQTTTVFDGTYVGVSRTFEEDSTPFRAGATWTRYCPEPDGPPVPLTIVNGTAKAGKLEGSVSQQGVLVMRSGRRFDGRIDSQGTVRGRSTGNCSYQLVWQKVPQPTMPFDGDYVGVSRESSGWGCPSNSVPSALIIRNNAALGSWPGSVSSQGSLVIQTPSGTQVRSGRLF
jgi:hypothetical protein